MIHANYEITHKNVRSTWIQCERLHQIWVPRHWQINDIIQVVQLVRTHNWSSLRLFVNPFIELFVFTSVNICVCTRYGEHNMRCRRRRRKTNKSVCVRRSTNRVSNFFALEILHEFKQSKTIPTINWRGRAREMEKNEFLSTFHVFHIGRTLLAVVCVENSSKKNIECREADWHIDSIFYVFILKLKRVKTIRLR